MQLILLGPPGVGKGTQADFIQQHYQIEHLSSGDIFRKEIKDQTELGKLAKSYIDKGHLLPDEVTMNMMKKHIQEVANKGFVLDGIPRTIGQADLLDQIFTELAIPLTAVIALEVDDEVVVQRISGRLSCPQCGAIYHNVTKPPKKPGFCDQCNVPLVTRSDDQPDTVRERLRVYHQTTKPLIDYYEQRGKLVRIDGSSDPKSVLEKIIQALSVL